MNPWVMVVLAGVLEAAWAIGLKYSEGFTRLWPTVFTAVTVIGSFWLLSSAMRSLPVGTAYAVWVGIGAVGTAIAAVILLNEPVSGLRVVGICTIVTGIGMLKFA